MKKLFYISLLLFPILSFGQAKIKFDSLVYNIKPVKVGQTTTLKIPFYNVGNKPLIITKFQGGNSSSVISAPTEPILPNQSSYLEIKILNTFSGNFKFNFIVGINNLEETTLIKVNRKVIDRTVFGSITDKRNEPLPGVTIIIKNTNKGTQTDFDGKYSLAATPNDTLVFSFIGYKTQKIQADKEVINLQMLEDEIVLNDKVGPVYRPIREKPFTRENITSVKTNSLPKEYKAYAKANSFLELLEKSIKYKKQNSEDEFVFKGLTNWNTLECSFEEHFYTWIKTESGEKIPVLSKKIAYYFKNQRLQFKTVLFFNSLNEETRTIDIYFYKKGTLKDIIDNDKKNSIKRYLFDNNGNLTERYNPENDKAENVVDTIKINLPKLMVLRNGIKFLEKGYDFQKTDFNIKDWKRFNKISAYLKKELNTRKNIYYKAMSDDQLDIITEDGKVHGLSIYNMKTQNLDEYTIIN